jgi:hypothetical protein
MGALPHYRINLNQFASHHLTAFTRTGAVGRASVRHPALLQGAGVPYLTVK